GQVQLSVDVAQVVPSLSLSANHQAIIYGRSVTLKAQMHNGAPGLTVTIKKTVAGVTSIVSEGVLNSNLAYAVTVRPKQNTSYVVVFDGSPSFLPAQSPTRSVGLRR